MNILLLHSMLLVINHLTIAPTRLIWEIRSDMMTTICKGEVAAYRQYEQTRRWNLPQINEMYRQATYPSFPLSNLICKQKKIIFRIFLCLRTYLSAGLISTEVFCLRCSRFSFSINYNNNNDTGRCRDSLFENSLRSRNFINILEYFRWSR